MALVTSNLDEAKQYAEKRADTSPGVNECVIVYQLDTGNYVADGVDPDDAASTIMPDGAVLVTVYGMCSYFTPIQPSREFIG